MALVFHARALGQVAILAVATSQVALAQPAQTPLPGGTIPKYVDPLPTFAGQRVGGPFVGATMKETRQEVLPHGVYQGLPAPFSGGTEVWAYQVSGLDALTGLPVSRGPLYPGVTVEAQRGTPTFVSYGNELKTQVLQPQLPVDQTVAWADPLGLGCVFRTPPP
jgi:hypothetical protein